MPFVSQAQRGLMHAVKAGHSHAVPLAVAEKFIAHDQGGKLPQHVDERRRRLAHHLLRKKES